MKKGRFLWSAHRITEKQKAGKARNIKEKQLKNSRNTVSKQLVAHLSSASDNLQLKNAKKARKYAIFRAFFYTQNSAWTVRLWQMMEVFENQEFGSIRVL